MWSGRKMRMGQDMRYATQLLDPRRTCTMTRCRTAASSSSFMGILRSRPSKEGADCHVRVVGRGAQCNGSGRA